MGLLLPPEATAAARVGVFFFYHRPQEAAMRPFRIKSTNFDKRVETYAKIFLYILVEPTL